MQIIRHAWRRKSSGRFAIFMPAAAVKPLEILTMGGVSCRLCSGFSNTERAN